MRDSARNARILFLTRSVGTDPSGIRRVAAPAGALRAAGAEAVVVAREWPWLERTRAAADAGDAAARRRLRAMNRWRLLGPARAARAWWTTRRAVAAARDADVVVQHREEPPAPWREAVRRSGAPVALDVDDALWLADPEGFERARAGADLVVAGSAVLARELEGRGSRVAVIPTCAPPRPAPLPGPGGPLRLLWLGSPTTAAHLRSAVGAIAEAARATPLRLVAAGVSASEVGAPQGLDIVACPRIPYDPATFLRDADAGIMPLPDGPWERGKCAAKIVDYMSAGLPSVASPVGANPEVLRDGRAGLLASTPGEWTEAILRLARDAALRSRLGGEARRIHAEAYGLDAAARGWLAVRDRLRAGRATVPSSGPARLPAGA